MSIRLIVVGKIKEEYYRNKIEEYITQIRKKNNFELIEIPDESIPKNSNDTINQSVKEKEGTKILSYINNTDYVVALYIDGKMMISDRLNDLLKETTLRGKKDIVFIIGGSLGLSKDIYKRADELLSFSPMTFPHQLMRVILLEQVYRCFRIIHNEPYHK